MIKFIKEQENGYAFTVNKCDEGYFIGMGDACNIDDYQVTILTNDEMEELIKFINIVKG